MSPQDRRFYAALSQRNPAYDGVFYVGVRTTGVFCRPTCPARPPKREHCEFFTDPQAALRARYRPCRRCRPLAPPAAAPTLVRRLVEAVEREPERRWRESDLAALSIHASTARRQFRRRFGMTFVQYARARRMEGALKAIRAGGRVIAAQLEAGYESGSGFREAFARLLGSPPAKRAARALAAAWIDTPLGPMVAVADDSVLHFLEFADRRGLDQQLARLRRRTGAAILPGRTPPIVQLEAELSRYFAGQQATFRTPRSRLATPFQRAVWDALCAIPAGQTRSYGALAAAAGKPSAVRAAGTANGANPFAIIVPCHRAIGADGSLTGYGGGLHRKRWLLEHERRWAQQGPLADVPEPPRAAAGR